MSCCSIVLDALGSDQKDENNIDLDCNRVLFLADWAVSSNSAFAGRLELELPQGAGRDHPSCSPIG